MGTFRYLSLLKVIACILFIFKAQFTYASMSAEDVINKLFETHGKENVASFIFQKRDRNITIQKNKSFLNIKGRPDIALITARTVVHDLKILKVDISTLEFELDIYIEKESKNQQEEDDRLKNSASIRDDREILLSNNLKYQIQATESKYKKSTSRSERRRLKKELSILRKAYAQAKNNEKSKLRVYFPDTRSKKTRNASYCEGIKSKLAKLTEPSYRHQIFFCNDRSYRAKNPKLCGKNKYVRQYTMQEHKDEIRKLRLELSNKCRS